MVHDVAVVWNRCQLCHTEPSAEGKGQQQQARQPEQPLQEEQRQQQGEPGQRPEQEQRPQGSTQAGGGPQAPAPALEQGSGAPAADADVIEWQPDAATLRALNFSPSM